MLIINTLDVDKEVNTDQDLDQERCQEYVHVYRLGHLCKSNRAYKIFTEDEVFLKFLDDKPRKIPLKRACPMTCKMVKGKL